MNRNAKAVGAILAFSIVSGCVTVDVDRALTSYRTCIENSDAAERLNLDPGQYRYRTLNAGGGNADFESAMNKNQTALEACDVAVQMMTDAQPKVGSDQDKGIRGTLMAAKAQALYLRSEIRSLLDGPPADEDGKPDWRQIHDETEITQTKDAAINAAASGSAFIGGNALLNLKTLPAYIDFARFRQGMNAKDAATPMTADEAKDNYCAADRRIRKIKKAGGADPAAFIRHAVNRVRMGALYHRYHLNKLPAKPATDSAGNPATFACLDGTANLKTGQLPAGAADYCSKVQETQKAHLCPVIVQACDAYAAITLAMNDIGKLSFEPQKDQNDEEVWRDRVRGDAAKAKSWSDIDGALEFSSLTGASVAKACFKTADADGLIYGAYITSKTVTDCLASYDTFSTVDKLKALEFSTRANCPAKPNS